MKRLIAVLIGVSLVVVAHAGGMLAVGQMMGPGTGAGSGPPAVTYYILTEASDVLATEAGTHLVTESAP